MGGDKKKEQAQQQDNYQNVQNYQQQRHEAVADPVINLMAGNYANQSAMDQGNYADMMNRYRQIESGAGEGGGGGGGGVSYSQVSAGPTYSAAGQYTPFLMGYSDPFKSYGGFEEFSQTGGYSPEDIANMRARGISPIRAAYGNAQREVNRQRSLQGGYSPNFIPAQAMMARQQGQSMADATQAVEAGLAQARNQGRLAGLGGMSNIEGQRLGADLRVSEYNAGAGERTQGRNIQAAVDAARAAEAAHMRAQMANQSAGLRAGEISSAAYRASMGDRFRALGGMQDLYGTTPAGSKLFGDQLLTAMGQEQNWGGNMVTAARPQQQPQGPSTMQNIQSGVGTAVAAATPILDQWNRSRRPAPAAPPVYKAPEGTPWM